MFSKQQYFEYHNNYNQNDRENEQIMLQMEKKFKEKELFEKFKTEKQSKFNELWFDTSNKTLSTVAIN